MANINDVKNAVQEQQQSTSLQTLIKNSAQELGKALPAHLNPERLVRIALTCIRLTPGLAQCTPESFLGSLFVLAQTGLEPIAGRAYLLPFVNNRKIGNQWVKVKEVQALIGYKGLIELFYRHESALTIDTQIVYEHDEFTYEYGTDSYLKHKPAFKDRGQVVAYYAIAKLKGGGSIFRVMSREDALDHGRKHSKTYDAQSNQFNQFSPWAKEPDAMCQKTVLIQLAKMLPLSVELQKAISVDETSREYKRGIDSAFDLKDTTDWNVTETSEAEPLEEIPAEQEQQTENNSQRDTRKITEPQLSRLMKIASDNGITDDQIKAHILEYYELTSKKDIQRWMYEDICIFAGLKK